MTPKTQLWAGGGFDLDPPLEFPTLSFHGRHLPNLPYVLTGQSSVGLEIIEAGYFSDYFLSLLAPKRIRPQVSYVRNEKAQF